MAVPSAGIGSHWASTDSPEIQGTAWGVPLVRRGRILESAGRGSTPGVLIDPDAAAPGPHDGVLVLHDLIDLDERHELVRARFPEARLIRRYRALMCDFGPDPEAFAREHLSSRRRARIRSDVRRLEEDGPVEVRWLRPTESDEHVEVFLRLIAERTAATGLWDSAVAHPDRVRRLWRDHAGTDLSVSLMTVGDRPVSYRSGFVSGADFIEYMPIADRTLDRVSLGDVHKRLLLDALAELGVTRHLMGKGRNEHKETWGTGTYTMSTVIVPGTGPRDAAAAWREGMRQRARRLLTVSRAEHPIRRILHLLSRLRSSTYRTAIREARSR